MAFIFKMLYILGGTQMHLSEVYHPMEQLKIGIGLSPKALHRPMVHENGWMTGLCFIGDGGFPGPHLSVCLLRKSQEEERFDLL